MDEYPKECYSPLDFDERIALIRRFLALRDRANLRMIRETKERAEHALNISVNANEGYLLFQTRTERLIYLSIREPSILMAFYDYLGIHENRKNSARKRRCWDVSKPFCMNLWLVIPEKVRYNRKKDISKPVISGEFRCVSAEKKAGHAPGGNLRMTGFDCTKKKWGFLRMSTESKTRMTEGSISKKMNSVCDPAVPW